MADLSNYLAKEEAFEAELYAAHLATHRAARGVVLTGAIRCRECADVRLARFA